MKRNWRVIACTLALGACSIEPTPQQYIDRRDSLADQIAVSETELERRLEDVADALRRRSLPEVGIALAPDSGLYVIGPVRGLSTPDELYALLDELGGGLALEGQDISVRIGGQNEVASFRSIYHEPDSVRPVFRFSGVFRRRGGEWRLVEGHISRPEEVAEVGRNSGAATTPEPGPGAE